MNLTHAQLAAENAVQYVRSGMVVGLGSGRTALFAVRKIGELVRAGKLENIQGIPCSSSIRAEAQRLHIPLSTLEQNPIIDLTIDGADEVDPRLNLIKGGGGALLHEKVVAVASRREIIVVDETKLSPSLGTERRLPVEVIAFGWNVQVKYLESLGARVELRQTTHGAPFRTDESHFILDCDFGPIASVTDLAMQLQARAGIVEHGLFCGLANEVIVSSASGIRHMKAEHANHI